VQNILRNALRTAIGLAESRFLVLAVDFLRDRSISASRLGVAES